MSEQVQKIGFGYIDDNDPSLKSKVGGKFGLNTGVNLVKFELNPNSGKDKSAGDALDIAYQVGEKEYTMKIFPVTKVYTNDNVEITDVNSTEYIKKYNEEWSQKTAVMIHILKSVGIAEDQIRATLATPANTFAEFIGKLVSLLPADFKTRPVDIFLEYQWNIADDQDRTFLQLPRNMKGGGFACPARPGVWEEQRIEGKLSYINQNGEKHPFEKDKSFMESNKANQQIKGASNALQAAAGGGAIQPGNGNAQKATW